MRTTLDIDEDVLLAARELAAREGISIGQAISRLARMGLTTQTVAQTRNGVPLFPVQPGAQVVTPELIKQLLNDEGL